MNKSFCKCFLAALALCGSAATFPSNTFALQGIAPSGPIGGTDINQALLPPPGLYVGLVEGYLNFQGWMDDNGNEIDAGKDAFISAAGLAYVYDISIFGGSVLSSVSTGYQDQRWTIAGSKTNHFYGMIDIYSDIFYWGRFFPSKDFTSQPAGGRVPYGFAVGTGLGVTLPTGSYDNGAANNVGSNVYTIAPSVALTYTTTSLLGSTLGEGTQFSVRVFYNEYTDQEDRHYRNGDILNTDYAITQIKGGWQYGLAGTYYVQVQDDEFLDGTTGVTNRTSMLSAGPVIAYNFTVKDHPYFAKLKSCFFIDGENVAKSSIAFLSIGTQF